MDSRSLILLAFSECRKTRIPTSSEVLATAELHHLLSLSKQIPKDTLSDEQGFWKWLGQAYKDGILPTIKLNIVEVTATCMAEGLEIIDETRKVQPLHSKRNGRVRQLSLDFE